MKYATLLLFALPLFGQTRIASDFEMQQMERQLEESSDFQSQVSGHLNLGDLHAARNETTLARSEYAEAYQIASTERLAARRDSKLTQYADATMAAALADAKLGRAAQAFALADEAMRFRSDSAIAWNRYANTMSLLHRPLKAVAASRNAVALAKEPLELAVDRYSLAASLMEAGQNIEAEQLLIRVIEALKSPAFTSIRRGVREHEAFEIYSTVTDSESAYIALLIRAPMRLGEIYEERGDAALARKQYQSVLVARTDEPNALAAMVRLAQSDDERARYFADAFNANPFSLSLIREYRRYLAATPRSSTAGATTGDQMRLALEQMQRAETAAARTTLDALQQKYPRNDTIALLRRELDPSRSEPVTLGPNRGLIAAFFANGLTPEQRAQLDAMTFSSSVIFTSGPPFETGTADGIPFRFSQPTSFQGTFAAQTPLRLTYRILGATRVGDADGFLLEPIKLEAAQ